MKKIISLGMLVAGLAVSALYGSSIIKASPTQAQNTNQPVATGAYQAPQHADLSNVSQVGQDLAKQKVQAFVGDPNLKVDYKLNSKNPYNGDQRMNVYFDDQGMEYWLNSDTNETIQYNVRPRTDLDAANEPRPDLIMIPAHSEKELAAIVQNFLQQRVPDIQKIEQQFSPSVNLKDDGVNKVYFFRWDANSYFMDEQKKQLKEFMPPFVQVNITAGGQIIGFSNTTSLYPGSIK